MLKIYLLSAIFFNTICYGGTFTYMGSIKDMVYTNEITVSSTSDGYLIKTKSVSNAVMEIETDHGFAQTAWILHDGVNNIEITAKRTGNIIAISGIFKGKQYNKEVKIDKSPWYEAWGNGLTAFAISKEKTEDFWSINPSDINMTAKFKANKIGAEKINVNGSQIEAVHIKVSLTGLLESFFSCDYWFRASDGREVLSKIPGGPGKSPVITELIGEEL